MTDSIPADFWHGVEQFNQQQYYACHDTLEALWMEAMEPEKTFYQGLLQLAVALYHLENQNWQGAVILLGEGSHRLSRYPSIYSGIYLHDLLDQSAVLLKTLQQAGPEGVATVASKLRDASVGAGAGDGAIVFIPPTICKFDEKL